MKKVETSIIIKLRQDNPCLTLEQIGNKYSVTKERVRQILAVARVPTRHWIPRYVCLNCGQVIIRFQRKSKPPLFCNAKCFANYHTVTLVCSECGKEFTLCQSWAIARCNRNATGKLFCSRQCYWTYGRRELWR